MSKFIAWIWVQLLTTIFTNVVCLIVYGYLGCDCNRVLCFLRLICLKERLQEEQLCIFFRKNHFSTMFKVCEFFIHGLYIQSLQLTSTSLYQYNGQLYILVTDLACLNEREFVWKEVSEVMRIIIRYRIFKSKLFWFTSAFKRRDVVKLKNEHLINIPWALPHCMLHI
jgi:hypothetical protein